MTLVQEIPRIVVAATGSGVGKTTASVALIGAMRARGLKVAPFKCGPDYLDPTYHQRAAGVRSHNLDGWMMTRDSVLATFARVSAGALLAAGRRCLRVAEEAGGTVMLIDAKNERVAGWYASYGAVSLLDAPLILVLPLRTIAAALKLAGKE